MTKVLLCPPTYFGVEYVINPWMRGNVGAASARLARRQWEELADVLDGLCEVTLIEPQPGLPDMCFAANGGFVFDGAFVPANFGVFQRSPEAAHYRTWATEAGLDVVDIDDEVAFEGEGRRAVVASRRGIAALRRLRRAQRLGVAPCARRTSGRAGGVAAPDGCALLPLGHLPGASAGRSSRLLPAGLRRTLAAVVGVPRRARAAHRSDCGRRLRLRLQRCVASTAR